MFISVIVISYRRTNTTIKCVKSLLDNSVKSHDIIIVDQGNNLEDHNSFKQTFPNIHVEINEKNLGVAGGRNLGAKFAKGEYLFFVDNDCTFEKNWDANLERILDTHHPDSLAIKLTSNVKDNSAPAFLDYANFPTYVRTNLFSDKTVEYETALCTFVPGVSLHKTKVFNELNRFDENYFIGYEDMDYCFKARNYKFLYTDYVSINHYHDSSDSVYDQFRNKKDVIEASRRFFSTKWQEQLKNGAGNFLLDSRSPKDLLQKRLDMAIQKVIKYEFFPDITKLAKLMESIHDMKFRTESLKMVFDKNKQQWLYV